jgi:hypothetical protein
LDEVGGGLSIEDSRRSCAVYGCGRGSAALASLGVSGDDGVWTRTSTTYGGLRWRLEGELLAGRTRTDERGGGLPMLCIPPAINAAREYEPSQRGSPRTLRPRLVEEFCSGFLGIIPGGLGVEEVFRRV